MGPESVVAVDIVLNGASQLPGIVVLVDVDSLRLEAAEPALNHDVVCPAGLAVHALAGMCNSFKRLLYSVLVNWLP